MALGNVRMIEFKPPTFVQRVAAAWRSYRKMTPQMGEVGTADPYWLYGGSPPRYNPSELISYRGYGVIDQMRKDDQVKAALAFKKQSVLAAGWQIKMPEGAPEDSPIKKEIERSLYNVDGSFNRAMKEILSALDYGFSVTEKVWEQKDNMVRLKKLASRKPHDITFEADPHGNMTACVQNAKKLPLDKLIIYTYDYEFSNHYGRSDLEAVYRAWWTKSNAYKWMAMLLERLGIPPVFALYNHNAYNPTQRETLQDVLKSLQAASVGAIPRGKPEDLEMWAPELAGQVSTVFLPAMEYLNKDISRALLMPGLIGLTDDQGQGSLARSQVHFDVFMLVLQAIREELQEIVNEQIIDDILMFNFGEMEDDIKPIFEFLPLTDDARLDILDRWTSLIGSEVVKAQDADEEHVRSMLKFPPMDESDQDAREQREMDKKAEQWRQRADAFGGAFGNPMDQSQQVPPADQTDEMKKFAQENDGVWIYDEDGERICVSRQ